MNGVSLFADVLGIATPCGHERLDRGIKFRAGCTVALDVARSAAALPAGVSLFSAFLAVDPMLHLLGADGTLHALSASARRIISDRAFTRA
jgi:hypothetical protein